MARRHPLVDLLGEGVMAGLMTYGVWRFVLRPIGRGIGRLGFRWRRVLTPVWCATGAEIVALIWHRFAPGWWPLALALVALGVGTGIAGPHLSKPVTKLALALVPDSVDAGRKGVLDRVPERVYCSLLLAYLGGWLALRVGAGPSTVTEYGWLAGLGTFGTTWWWHRRIRVAGRADRYARKWRKLAAAGTNNPKFKILADSKVVKTAGTRRGICTLTVRLAHGYHVADVTPLLANIASWYRLRPNAVSLAEDESNSSRVVLRFMPRDPWRGNIPHPWPTPGTYTLAGMGKRLPVGLQAAGEVVMWFITHALMVGRTGAGKSWLLESILVWLTGALDAVVVGADLASGATLAPWRRTLALPLAEDYDATVILLHRVMAVIEDREQRLGAAKEADDEAGDSFEPSPEHPWLFLVIDEYPDFVAEALVRSTKEYHYQGKEVLLLMGRIGKRGRKSGVEVILAAQNGSKADTGSKELQAQLKSLFGLRLDAHANKVLWKDLLRAGWSSVGLKTGQFLLNDDDHTTPDIAKGYSIDRRRRREHIQAAAQLHKALEPSAFAALTDTMDEVVAAGMVVPAPAAAAEPDIVLDCLLACPVGATAADLTGPTGLSRATVFRRLRALKTAGLATSANGVWRAVRQPAEAA